MSEERRKGGEQGRPARVLLVSHSARLYGAERSLLLLARNLERRRFEPLVALPGDGPLREELEKIGVDVVFVNHPWWVRASGRWAARLALPVVVLRELLTQPRACRLIREREIDLVYTNTSVIGGGALAARRTGRPHVWFVREILAANDELNQVPPLGMLHRMILGLSSVVLTNSRATAEPLALHDRANKLTVVYNAVSPLPGDEPPLDPAVLEGIEPGDRVAVMVGTVQRFKAPEDAIGAVAAARDRIPNLKLLLIGGGRQDYINRLNALAGELGIADAVVFAGFRKDARQLAAACMTLIMASPAEPFGRVVAEAMLDGLPVVAVRGGGMAELVDDGATGLLCPPRDPRAMAEKLVQLHDDPDMARSLAASAQRKASVAFSAERHVRGVEEAMARALEERR